MKIGVVSDSHSRPLPEQMLKDFQSCDMIIHVGDFCSVKEYKYFKKLKTLEAVFGNVDSLDLQESLPAKKILKLEGVRIGLYHGDGPPLKVLEHVREYFKGEPLDLVIFGHSHLPLCERTGKTLYFNPGSPTDTIRPPYCSYGIIELNAGKIKADIVKVEEA